MKKQLLITATLVIGIGGFYFATSAYEADDFTTDVSSFGVSPGATNVFLGSFTTPTPASDTVITDGATDNVEAGDQLTAFDEAEKYIDVAQGGSYQDGYVILNSADTSLDSADAIAKGADEVLTPIGTSEAVNAIGYLDVNTSATFNEGEDLVRVIKSGSDAALASGDAIRTMPVADEQGETGYLYFFNSSEGDDSFDTDKNYAILEYENDDDRARVQGVIQGGDIGFTRIEAGDGLCYADVDDNNLLDPGAEDLFFDVDRTCASFDTGVDIRITDDGGVGGTSRNLATAEPNGLVATLGFLDSDEDGAYDCERGGLCEGIFAFFGVADVPTGEDVTPGGMYQMFDGSQTDLVDGVTAVAVYANELVGQPNFVRMDSGLTQVGGEDQFFFIDSDADTVLDAEEDVLELEVSYGVDTLATGNQFRFFPANHAYFDGTGEGRINEFEPIFESVDTDLDVGNLNGTGTDTLILGFSGILSSFAESEMYYDHDESGSFVDGDDIVSDDDGSGYFDADILNAAYFVNDDVLDYPAGDDDIDAIYVYRAAGASCSGSGTDTQVATKATAPFLDTRLTVTDAAFTAATEYCVYVDIADDASHGEYFQIKAEAGELVFGSMESPTDGRLDIAGASYVGISGSIAATFATGTLTADTEADYTVSFESTQLLTNGDRITVLFPEEYDVTGGSMTCELNEVPLAGASSVGLSRVNFTVGEDVDDFTPIECVVTVVNPEDNGEYDDFRLFTYRDADVGLLSVESDSDLGSFTITGATAGGGSSSRRDRITQTEESSGVDEQEGGGETDEEEGAEETTDNESKDLSEEMQAIVELISKDLVKIPGVPTVFYVAPDGFLRAFFTEGLFFSWGLSFDDVREVPVASISGYPLGAPMPPRPGSALIKSPQDARVYVLEPNNENPASPILHWVSTEEVAEAYFGADWAAQIIDVDASIIALAQMGEDLTDPENPPSYIELYK